MNRLGIVALAVVLGLTGVLMPRSTPAAEAVGTSDDTSPVLISALEWTGPNTPVHDVLLIWDDLLDESLPLALGDFDVQLDDVSLDLAAVEYTHAGFIEPESAATIMTVFLTDPVTASGTLTVSYTPSVANPITDVAGNVVTEPIDASVDVYAFGDFGAVLALVDGNFGPDHLGLLFNDAVAPASLPPASAFKVIRNGTEMTPLSPPTIFPAFSGRILDIGLPEGVRSGDVVTIAYTAPPGGGIENLVGTAAPDFPAWDVSLLLVAEDSVDGSTGATGGSVSTDVGDPGPTAQDPVATTVGVPGAASVLIDEGAVDLPPSTTEYTFIGETVEIEVTPDATPDAPIVIDFAIDASVLAAVGATEANVQVLRNGVPVGPCTGAPDHASPDPCIASRTAVPVPPDPLEYGLIRVLTSQASSWAFAVRFPWAGFLQPVDNPPTANLVNAGRAVPVKFTLGGDQGLAIFAGGSPTSEPIDCESGVATDVVETTTAAGSSSLSYDPGTGVYSYVWKTDRAWASAPGGPCRRLILGFTDGSTREALFRFR